MIIMLNMIQEHNIHIQYTILYLNSFFQTSEKRYTSQLLKEIKNQRKQSSMFIIK